MASELPSSGPSLSGSAPDSVSSDLPVPPGPRGPAADADPSLQPTAVLPSSTQTSTATAAEPAAGAGAGAAAGSGGLSLSDTTAGGAAGGSASSSSADVPATPPTVETVQLQMNVLVVGNDDHQQFVTVAKGQQFKVRKVMVKAEALVGCAFGSVFELRGHNLVQVPASEWDPLESEEAVDKVEEITADNRHLTDNNSAQALGQQEIASLKASGASGREIVDELVKNSVTFQGKTAFSQAKYLKRKRLKYVKLIRVLKPTAFSICEALFAKSANKIAELRPDSLALLLTYANVHCGSRVLLYDCTNGLVTGAIAERLAGEGLLLRMYDTSQPSEFSIRLFNLPAAHAQVIKQVPVSQIAPFVHGALPIAAPTKTEDAADGAAEAKRRGLSNEQVQEMLAEGFDTLVFVCQGAPGNSFLQAAKLMRPGSAFVVFSPYMEGLGQTYYDLQQREMAVHVFLSETWTREYQVLPQRTHPAMRTHGASGYLLHGYLVESDGTVQAGASGSVAAGAAAGAAGTAAGADGEADGSGDDDDEAGAEQAAKRVRVDE